MKRRRKNPLRLDSLGWIVVAVARKRSWVVLVMKVVGIGIGIGEALGLVVSLAGCAPMRYLKIDRERGWTFLDHCRLWGRRHRRRSRIRKRTIDFVVVVVRVVVGGGIGMRWTVVASEPDNHLRVGRMILPRGWMVGNCHLQSYSCCIGRFLKRLKRLRYHYSFPEVVRSDQVNPWRSYSS
jgi:hypothetical protein